MLVEQSVDRPAQVLDEARVEDRVHAAARRRAFEDRRGTAASLLQQAFERGFEVTTQDRVRTALLGVLVAIAPILRRGFPREWRQPLAGIVGELREAVERG